MSGFNNRYVGMVKETTYGTDPGSGYVYGEVDDESIKHTYDVLRRDDMSRYGAAKSNTGKEYSEGDINMAAIADDFTGLLLTGLFPTDTVSGVGPYLHTFTEAGTDRSFTLKVGREEKEHTYTGVAVDSLSVSANLNEYAMVSASFMGKAEGSVASLGSPTFPDASQALYFADAKVFFNGNATASNLVKSISFDINLNRDGDNACGLGDATYTRIPPTQRREVSGTIEFNKIIHAAVSSEPTYTQLTSADGYELSGSGVELQISLGEEGGTFPLIFKFYKIRFEAPDANVSGRDTQTMSVPFVALYSTDDSKMMDITMLNSQSSAY